MNFNPIFDGLTIRAMKLISQGLSLLIASVLLWGCTTEIDLIADPKETAVVYALLDQGAPVQYFRINPTFIGEADAKDLAGDPSLTNYGPEDLEVRLINVTSDQSYLCDTTTSIKMEPGFFNSEYHLMYQLQTPVSIVDGDIINDVLIPDNDYQLLIRNTKTNNEFTSTITLGDVNEFAFLLPGSNRTVTRNHLRFANDNQFLRYTFELRPVTYAERYEVNMIYHYSETVDGVESDTLSERFYIGETQRVTDQDAKLFLEFDGERFYTTLAERLEVNPNISRKGFKIDLEVTMIGKDLDKYMQVQNSIPTGFSQEVLSYTNINQGIGVFSFRSNTVSTEYWLSTGSADQLRNHSLTAQLNFCTIRVNSTDFECN